MDKYILIPTLVFFMLFSDLCFGQGSTLQKDNPAYQIMDRLEITSGIAPPFHSMLKSYDRRDIVKYTMMIDSLRSEQLTTKDQWDIKYIYTDNNEWLSEPELPLSIGEQKREDKYKFNNDEDHAKFYKSKKPLLKHFYKTPANLFETGNEYYYFKLNPILDLSLMNSLDTGQVLFNNLRGIEIRAGIDNRVFIYSNILENQRRFPIYVNNFIEKYQAVPRSGRYRVFKSQIFGSENSFDLLNSDARIGFNVLPHVGVELGYGSNFIGNGYRSMLLSDFSQNYFHLKLNWRIGKLHLQNIFGELHTTSTNARPGNTLVPKKYFAGHFLNFRITKNLSFGLYETVVFRRDAESGQFELQYLNPIILYRTVEILLGSPDNVTLGTNIKWNFLNRFQLYGQFLFDTFVFEKWIVNDQDWWGKKYGAQIGLNYVNVAGIDHLDLRLEANVARPYTYSHRDTLNASYSHNNTPLAHPLGANFREFVAILNYRPSRKWYFRGRFIRATFGEDSNGSNWGGNILLNNETFEMPFGNKIAQGVTATTNLVGIDIQYELAHNTFLVGSFFLRNKDSIDNTLDLSERYIGGGFRMNINVPNVDF